MKIIVFILFFFVSIILNAFPPSTHGIIKPVSGSSYPFSNAIMSKIAHWQSAKDMPALADGTAIDSVQDISGNNRTISNTSTARPLYYSTRNNGYPSWYFDGTNDVFNIPTYTTRGGCLVVNVDSTRTSFALLEGFYGSRSTASPNAYWGTDGGSTILDFSPSGNYQWMDAYAATGRNFFYPSGNTFRVICFTTSTGVTDATGWQIGSDRKFGSRFLKGNISEVIGFSGYPTKKQLDTINDYLWTKYNLLRPINFVQDGNSIGLGGGAYTRDSIGLCAYSNMSVGGQNTFYNYQNAPTKVDTSYGYPYGNKQVVYLLEGTNDLINFGADSCYAHMMLYANARIAVGWKVVISTVLSHTPSGVRAGYEADRVALNVLINATTQTNSLKIVDFGQDANLSDPSAYSNTTYFSDGIHPTATGYKLIAKYASQVIKSFTW